MLKVTNRIATPQAKFSDSYQHVHKELSPHKNYRNRSRIVKEVTDQRAL